MMPAEHWKITLAIVESFHGKAGAYETEKYLEFARQAS